MTINPGEISKDKTVEQFIADIKSLSNPLTPMGLFSDNRPANLLKAQSATSVAKFIAAELERVFYTHCRSQVYDGTYAGITSGIYTQSDYHCRTLLIEEGFIPLVERSVTVFDLYDYKFLGSITINYRPPALLLHDMQLTKEIWCKIKDKFSIEVQTMLE